MKTGRFIIRDLTAVVGGNDLMHALHRHDYYFILAIDKGSGIHEIDFTPYEIHDSSVFVLRPGQVHQLTLKAGCTGYLLEFDTSFYQPVKTIGDQRWKKAISRNFCAVTPAVFPKLLSGLEQIFAEYTLKEDGFAETINAGLDLFFISYLRQSTDPALKVSRVADYNRERFEEFTQTLEACISTEKSVAGYAKRLNLSVYQLSSITKSLAGKTISEMINDQILLEAKRHLLGTSAQIKDIAFDLGYEDVSYFVRFFKKHTGLSPDAFRKNLK